MRRLKEGSRGERSRICWAGPGWGLRWACVKGSRGLFMVLTSGDDDAVALPFVSISGLVFYSLFYTCNGNLSLKYLVTTDPH